MNQVIKQYVIGRILGLTFVKEALTEAKRQGGMEAFPLAHKDIIETMADDLDKKAEELAKKKLADLLSVVDPNMIVTVDNTNKRVFIGGVEADPSRLANLKSEADIITELDLWKLLTETPKDIAQRAMFISSESLADLQKGKSMLYTLSLQKNTIDIFKSYIPK